ncbi:MAG TPA: hypothetical protein VHL57_09620 [Flavobacteriales bacterium]|jgi:hypothetical protein|nr:hypothetical protein [Flavobacteriales bacterium]
MTDRTPARPVEELILRSIVADGTGSTITSIQAYLHMNGNATSVRGVTLVLDRMEHVGHIKRVGAQRYALTPVGRKAVSFA